MHLKNMHRYFFTYILFTIFASRFAEFSCQRVGKPVFTQRAQPKMRKLCKEKEISRIFVPASGKTCFHATSAAENAMFV